MESTRTVPVSIAPRIVEAVAKINRKAERLGAAGFSVTFGEMRVESRWVRVAGEEEMIEVEVVDATISGETVEVSGYRLLSRIDFEDGLVLVNSRPGEQLPESFRSTTPVCQHCASQRRRKAVFVFRRNGDNQHVQVGSSCLKDFLGHDPARVLHSISIWSELSSAIDSELSDGSWRDSQVVGVERVLEIAAAAVREANGAFVSRAAAQAAEERGRRLDSTSSLVFGQLFPPRPMSSDWRRVEVTPTDTEHARAAIAWALDSFGRPGASEYESNLHKLVGRDVIQLKRIGIVVSLIGAFNRHLGILAERAKKVNAHVGQVGQRREFDAAFDGASSYETDYGTVYIGRFNSPEGQLVYKGASPFWPSGIKPGDAVRMKATIKKHDEYKGFCQTYIQRAALVEQQAA